MKTSRTFSVDHAAIWGELAPQFTEREFEPHGKKAFRRGNSHCYEFVLLRTPFAKPDFYEIEVFLGVGFNRLDDALKLIDPNAKRPYPVLQQSLGALMRDENGLRLGRSINRQYGCSCPGTWKFGYVEEIPRKTIGLLEAFDETSPQWYEESADVDAFLTHNLSLPTCEGLSFWRYQLVGALLQRRKRRADEVIAYMKGRASPADRNHTWLDRHQTAIASLRRQAEEGGET